MIDLYVQRFEGARSQLESSFAKKKPESYLELVTETVKAISSGSYTDLDSSKIHEINDGEYQGALVYLIAEKGYQPIRYWAAKIFYGSCSVCDALQSIEDEPENERAALYVNLARNFVQELKEV